MVACSSETGMPIFRSNATSASVSTLRSSASSITCMLLPCLRFAGAARLARITERFEQAVGQRAMRYRDRGQRRGPDCGPQRVSIPQDDLGDRSIVNRAANLVQLGARSVPGHHDQARATLPNRLTDGCGTRGDPAGPSGEPEEAEQLTARPA